MLGFIVILNTLILAVRFTDRVAQGGPRAQLLLPLIPIALLAILTPPFVLGKAAGQLAMPTGLLWLTILAGVFWALLKGKRKLARIIGGLALVYTLAGSTLLGSFLLRTLEADYRPVAPNAQHFDAIYVLGGGTSVNPAGHPQLGGSGDRVLRAALWYRTGGTTHLLTGGRSVAGLDQDHTRSLAEETRRLWLALGIPDSAITVLDGPRNTREEMATLAQYMATHPDQSVAVLTSAWHLRRTMRLAHRSGLSVTPLPADHRGRTPVLSVVSLIPSGHGFYLVRVAVWEYLGAALGR